MTFTNGSLSCHAGRHKLRSGLLLLTASFLSLAIPLSGAGAESGGDGQIVEMASGGIEYVVSGPEDGEPVLLIHGSGLAEALAPLAAAPELQDYRLVRMHRRGYAGSSPIEGEAFSIAQQAQDALELLERLGIENVHVAGHSFGAAIALQMAMDSPERVTSVVVIDIPAPGVQPDLHPPAGDPAQLLQSGDGRGAVGAFFTVVFGDDWEDFFTSVPGGLEQAAGDMETVLRFEGPSMQAWRFDPSRIAQPMLWVWGEESANYAKGSGELVSRLFQRPVAAVVIGGSDHALVTEKPGEVAQAMAGFLSRHAP